MEADIFKALIGHDPRLIALLEWRLALGELTGTQQVMDCFLEDWNKIEDVFKRVEKENDDR